MSDAPDAEESVHEAPWLAEEALTELRELAAQLGTVHCLNARQLALSPEFFPDKWTGDLRSMRLLLRRIMAHAGLPDADLAVEVLDARTGAEEFGSHLSTDVDFVGWTSGRAQFAVSTLGDPRATIGPACIEVGRAVLQKRRVEALATNYRADASHDAPVELPTPHEGFLAAYLLGWGVLVTNASFDPRSAGQNVGYHAQNAWIASTVLVNPGIAAWILAALWRARPDQAAWSEQLRKELNPSQRKSFDRAFAELEGQAEELRAELTWSADHAGRPLDYDPLRPLRSDAHDDSLDAIEHEAALARKLPNRGQPVFRVHRRRTMELGLVGAVVGILYAAWTNSLLVLVSIGGGAMALGYVWRKSYCSDPNCRRPLGPDTEDCTGCGGFVAGTIDKESQRLDALEAYEDRQEELQARQGLD